MIETYNNMIMAAGKYKRLVQGAILLGFLGAIFTGIFFALLFPFLDYLLEDNDQWRQIGYWMIGLVVVVAILRVVEADFGYNTQMDVAHDVRIKLGEKLRNIPLEYLHSRQAGDFNAVLSTNVHQVVTVMGGLYGMIIQTIVAPVTTILITLFIDWRLAVAMAVIFPLGVPLYQLIRKVAGREYRAMTDANAAVSTNLIEYSQGLDVLRATRQVGPQSVRLQKSLADLKEISTSATNWGIAPNITMSSIVQVGMLLVTMIGIFFVLGGTLSISVLLAFIAIAVRYAEPLSIFASLTTMLDFMESGLERINDLQGIKEIQVDQPAQALTQFDIEFDDVDFAYAPDELDDEEGEQVLHNVTFYLPAKTLTALVGESGGGKTTVTKLISRYADPQRGSVKIGGVDIRSVEPNELMRHISVVFQDVYLFDDTIRDNIRMAKPNATDAEVEAAAEAANCHEFITRLPDGYDTFVGEIGGSLSGGERQRISIARAILKDAPIVLLDEPTSALDTESEVAVQRAIDRLVEDKTVVVIAHRLSTVVAADQILVLEDGRIVERGTHDDLLDDESGRYAAMWAAQQQVRRWKV
ncbi:MAG: ABC transporter ATP-binding protein [Chloroflexota bacterium]